MVLTYLEIDNDAVVFRRWPWRKRRVARRDVDRFAVLEKKGEDGLAPLIWIGSLRWPRAPYDYVALLMNNGGHVRVPGRDSEPAVLALRLNNELLESQ